MVTLFPALFFLLLVGVFLLLAYTRTGSVDRFPIKSRVIEFMTPRHPAELFAVISRGVGQFKLEDSDADRGLVLLTTTPTLGTWGFFYPVAIEALPSGGSRVRVGIASRVFQMGPLVTKWHKKCAEAIQSNVVAPLPTAQVVG